VNIFNIIILVAGNFLITVIILTIIYRWKIYPLQMKENATIKKLRDDLVQELDILRERIKRSRRDEEANVNEPNSGTENSSFKILREELNILNNKINTLTTTQNHLQKHIDKISKIISESESGIEEKNAEISPKIPQEVPNTDNQISHSDNQNINEPTDDLHSILLNLKSQGFNEAERPLQALERDRRDKDFIHAIISIYLKIFATNDKKTAKLLESILTNDFKIEITHPLQNAHYKNYAMFLHIPYASRHTLSEIEKQQIKDVTAIPEKKGLIIKEIIPHIEYNGEIISQGKILIS
jgi:hypothetical protein